MRRRCRSSTTSMAASSWRRRRCSSTSACRGWATRRCSSGSSRSASWPSKRAQARCRHLGISRARAHPHLLGGVVLGRLRPARPDRRAVSGWRPRGRYWRGQANALREEILERAWNEAKGAFVGALDDPELDASVLRIAEIGPGSAARPAFRLDLRRDRPRAAAQRPHHALHRRRRFRRAGDGVSRLQFLVHRCAGGDRPARRGARVVHRSARPPQLLRAVIRGHPSGDRGAVGQLPADLFDGRASSIRRRGCR